MEYFKKAEMIFLESMRSGMNVQAGFRKDFSLEARPGSIVLRITARTFYKAYINGEFAFYGPARAAHEHARVDIIDISDFTHAGFNSLAVEVAGYNVGNLYVTGEYSFLMAEIEADGDVIAFTDKHWTGLELRQKRGYAENYSHARCISELYDLDAGYYNWRTADDGALASFENVTPVEEIKNNIRFLERGSGIPDYQTVHYTKLLNVAAVVPAPEHDRITHLPFMTKTVPENKEQGPIERPVVDCRNDKNMPFSGRIDFGAATGLSNAQEITVHSETEANALDFDFEEMASAFPGIEFTCSKKVTIDLIHADKLTRDGNFDARNCYSITVIRLHCEAGRYRFEAFEPYGVRYLRVIIRGAADFVLHDVFMRRCQYPDVKGGSFLCSDHDLNEIYEAARTNLRQNTFDAFLDCPGRERGAWASDSFWTARTARLLFGDTKVERAHLENFLADSVGTYFPDFVPACYPAQEGCLIHNWTIFLGLELYEYYRRTADRQFCKDRAAQVERLVGTLSKYENQFGLLENLPEIVYVDGTTASDSLYNKPISTATNANYAVMLRRLGEIYNRMDWIKKAEAILGIIRGVCVIQDTGDFGHYVPDAFSFDGNGNITRGTRSSEGAQYVCMWRDLMDRDKLPGFFRMMFEEFGVNPLVPLSTSTRFVLRMDMVFGMCTRFEVLHKFGEHEKLMSEMRRLYTYMLDHGPGTLWEGWSIDSNVNHGYPSHAAVWLFKAFLGLNIPDEVEKTIDIAPHPCGLKWAKGYTVAGAGVVSVSWKNDAENFELAVTVPGGYRVNLAIPDELYGWEIHLEFAATGERTDISPRQKHVSDIERSFTMRAVKVAE